MATRQTFAASGRRSDEHARRYGTKPRAAALGCAAPVSHLTTLQAQAAGSPAVQRLQSLQALADGTTGTVQRAAEEEELLQGKLIQREASRAEGSTLAPDADSGLPRQLRAGIEGLSGVSMEGVKVHRNSDAPAQVGAHAFAQGRDIHLAPGQERHLPHEAWHVVQQAQGRVRPTTEVNGSVVNDDPSLEAEADRMGARAQAGAIPSQSLAVPYLQEGRASALQRKSAKGVLQLQQTKVCLKSATGKYTTPNNATPVPFNFREASKATTKSHPNALSGSRR